MRLPKFWNDSGRWNDLLVQTAVVLSTAGWALISYLLKSTWLAMATIILGPLMGFVVGVLLASLLSTYFSKR